MGCSLLCFAVGYINTTGRDGGQMVSASFMRPGASKYRVSDIQISGYEEAFYENDFSVGFNILDNGGRTLMGKDLYFSYNDGFDFDNYSGFLGGKWYNNSVEIVPGGENDFELENGQAVWLQMPAGSEGVVKFGTAGEVIQAEVPIPLIDGGNGIGNPMAVGVWVSDLIVSGYEEAFYENDFSIGFNILDNGGRTLMGKDIYFSYNDGFDFDNYSGFLGGKWYNNGVEIVPHGEGDFQLMPGVGVWLQAPAGSTGNVVFTFPQVVGEQAVK